MNIILGPVDLVVGKSSKDREKIPPSITCLRAEKAIQTSLGWAWIIICTTDIDAIAHGLKSTGWGS